MAFSSSTFRWIAVYERYVSTPWSEWWSSDGEFTGHALLRIAELGEMVGDSGSCGRTPTRSSSRS